MNTPVVLRLPTGEVTVQTMNADGQVRNLTLEEMYALEGLLNEAEFEQHLQQDTFV